jgi:hypothetical protein
VSAELVRRAFQHAENGCSTGNITPRGYWPAIDSFIDTHALDRRYRLHLLAATHPLSSAIVRYRGIRYYLEGTFNRETQSRIFAITRTN